MEKWGLKLKKLREERHLTQDDVAERAPMKRVTYGSWEKDKKERLNPDDIQGLARAFEMSPEIVELSLFGKNMYFGQSTIDNSPNSIDDTTLYLMVKDRLEKSEILTIKYDGLINAGNNKQAENLGSVQVPKIMISGDANMAELKAYKVAGNELNHIKGYGDGVSVIATPVQTIIDGKMYILDQDGDIIASQVHIDKDEALYLVHGKPTKKPVSELKIKGRIICHGSWEQD